MHSNQTNIIVMTKHSYCYIYIKHIGHQQMKQHITKEILKKQAIIMKTQNDVLFQVCIRLNVLYSYLLNIKQIGGSSF